MIDKNQDKQKSLKTPERIELNCMVFPFHLQKTQHTCGPAAMRMVLEYCGIKKSEEEIAALMHTTEKKGTPTENFSRLAKAFDLECITAEHARLQDLKFLRDQNYLVIVCYFYPTEKVDHYSIVKKIQNNHIYFWDPFFGTHHKYFLPYFRNIWRSDPNDDDKKHWFFALKPKSTIKEAYLH
jgi:predicted double-glycine peptidase